MNTYRIIFLDETGAEIGEAFEQFACLNDALFCGPDTDIEYSEARVDMEYRHTPDARTAQEESDDEMESAELEAGKADVEAWDMWADYKGWFHPNAAASFQAYCEAETAGMVA